MSGMAAGEDMSDKSTEDDRCARRLDLANSECAHQQKNFQKSSSAKNAGEDELIVALSSFSSALTTRAS